MGEGLERLEAQGEPWEEAQEGQGNGQLWYPNVPEGGCGT